MISEKITHLCKLKGITLRAACQAAGLKYSTLHAQIANDRPIPFLTIDKLSRTLNVPVSYFSDQQPVFQFEPPKDTPQSALTVTLERAINEHTKELAGHGLHISIDSVLDWLVQNDFRLTNSDWLKDRIDLFYPQDPDEPMIYPARIGEQSLSSQFLGLKNGAAFEDYLTKVDSTYIKRIAADYAEVAHRKYSVTDQAIDVTLNDARVRGSYRRLLAGVTDPEGQDYTLVFCRLIRFING